MVAFYQHNISAWMDGTESMPDGEYRAYHVIIQLIYLQNGPIVYNEAGIAGRCNQHVLKFRANFKKLCDAGKLAVVDGKITNKKATNVLGEIARKRKPIPGQPTGNPPATPEAPPPTRVEVVPGSRGGLANKPLKTHDLAEVEFALEPSKEPRITEIDKDAAPNGAPGVDPSIAERELFERGKFVLGKNAGGQIANLLKSRGGNVSIARSLIELASTKQNAREFIAAAIARPPPESRVKDVRDAATVQWDDARRKLKDAANRVRASDESGGPSQRLLPARGGE